MPNGKVIINSLLFILLYSNCVVSIADVLNEIQAGFRFQKLPNEHQLSHISIKDIVQNENGIVWIATGDGLNRFDGNESSIYRPSNSDISHHSITSLSIDHRQQLWVGTQKGLNRYDANLNKFTSFSLSNKKEQNTPEPTITKIFEDSLNRLWVGTETRGVYMITKNRKQITRLLLNSPESQIESYYVHSFFETSNKNILIATQPGLYHFAEKASELNPYKSILQLSKTKNKKNTLTIYELTDGKFLVGTVAGLYKYEIHSKQYKPYLKSAFENKIVRTIKKFSSQELLVGTEHSGLFLINLKNHSYKHYAKSTKSAYSIRDDKINTIYKTNDNLYWIGTNLGINILNPNQKRISHYLASDDTSDCLSGNTIYAMTKDKNNILWVASYGNGLHKLSLKNNFCDKFYGTTSEPDSKQLSHVISLYEDKNSNIWIGTINNGIFKYDRKTELIQRFKPTSSNTPSVKPHTIMSITGDDKGRIWFATFYSGLFEYDIATKKLTNYIPELKNNINEDFVSINNIAFDKKNSLWMATNSHGVWQYDISKKTFTQSQAKGKNGVEIPETLNSVYIDRGGNIWVGSKGEGAYKINQQSNEITKYTIEDGLLNNVILTFEQDNQANMWLFTDKGLSRISASDNKIYTLLEKDGMQADAFTTTSFYDKNEDTMWTGGINGFNKFRPNELDIGASHKNVVLTNFELFYSPVEINPNKKKSPLTQAINETTNLILNHDQNVFSFSFSALEYLSPERINYAFMLEGYDAKWNYVNSNRRYANYTNLDPGEYIFKVKATDKYGNWNEKEKQIAIDIRYPWWKTNIAYFSYFLISIMTIYFIILSRTKILTKRSKQLEKTVKERTSELNQEKDKVTQLLARKNEEFANISHEFRTPLTLILGPLTKVLQSKQLKENINRLNIIQRNGYRLLRMVDQLLNLEKFRVKAITHKSPQAIGKSIKFIAEAFIDLAAEKNIELIIHKIDDVNFEFTPDAIEKIILNLLSNAIKFTKDGGKIEISAKYIADNFFEITVSDSGIGIPQDKINQVFERFNRLLDENSEQVTGAGIGLALVKSLVEAHQGTINLKSEIGKGSCFVVTLPIINPVSKLDPHANSEALAMELMSISNHVAEHPKNKSASATSLSSKKPIVLVIEDNLDMREYIIESIESDYHTLTARDGEEGLKIAIEEVPDLIISDIMMPKKDGYQTTQALRENEVTNHIPIILLTARGDRASRLKAWQEKADEYLTKPFDAEELGIRLSNLLDIRNILKKRFSETVFNTTPTQASKDNETELDSIKQKLQYDFIQKLDQFLEIHFTDPSTSIQMLASAVIMSERQLFRKLKSVFDMTPSEYLRRFRLEKAKQLLIEGKSVSYTTFEVGFASQSYFSKCFKAQFGYSPNQTRGI